MDTDLDGGQSLSEHFHQILQFLLFHLCSEVCLTCDIQFCFKQSDSCSHTRGEALMKRASAFGNQQLDTESEGEILEAAEEKT